MMDAKGSDQMECYPVVCRASALTAERSACKVVYERALAAFPLTHFLWLTYTRYLEAHLKIPAIVNGVFARAVRNTPWVGAIWARALNALERSSTPDDEQAAMYQRATSASLQVMTINACCVIVFTGSGRFVAIL